MTDVRAPRIVFVAANPSIDRLYELERLAIGEIHRPISVVAVPGGKGLNAARAAAVLGARVTAVGIVGGHAGDWIVERLAAIGLDARMARTTGETRTCVSLLDRASGELTEVYESGVPVEATTWEELEAILARELDGDDVGAVALSGSLPPGAPPDGFGRLARLTAGRSVAVLADTSGEPLASVLAAGPSVVKVNASEASDTTGVRVVDVASAAAAAASIRDLGAGAVVVTLGVDGAVVATATETIRLVQPDVRGLYAVGSGDAFLAGLAVALTSGTIMVEAARLGLAAGVANAQVPGAGELDPESIPGLLEAIDLVAI